MAKKLGQHRDKLLSALTLKTKGAGRHYDGAGLFLEVDESGARRWLLRTTVHGRRRDIGLGSLKTVSLSEAREEAASLRKIARAGGDPLAERRKKAAPTFETAARQCYDERSEGWDNPKHKAQWLSSLETYAYPTIGKLRVDRVDSAELLRVLSPIWLSKPATARRVRQRVGLVLDWAKAKGYRPLPSPTRELGRALAKQPDVVRHHPSLPYNKVPAFIRAMRETGSTDATKDALEFLILNANRTMEVLDARWSEINFNAKTWTVPAGRDDEDGNRTSGMKSKKPHTIPLAPRSVEILKTRRSAHSGRDDLIFEAQPGERLSQMTLLMILRRMGVTDANGEPAVVHGFRTSFKDWATERTNMPDDVSEVSLAHVDRDKTRRAYKRTNLLEKRRKLLADWATFCSGGAKVLTFRRVAN